MVKINNDYVIIIADDESAASATLLSEISIIKANVILGVTHVVLYMKSGQKQTYETSVKPIDVIKAYAKKDEK